MIHYLDTSVLVSALTNEPRSAEVYEWLSALSAPLFTSDWVSTEFAAALAMKVRSGTLSQAKQAATQSRLDKLFASSFDTLPIASRDFVRAAELAQVARAGLRAGDALHLALAERHRAVLCTLDKAQAAAADVFGISIRLV